MKVLIIVDKLGTAIDRLAQAVKRNLPQHQIVVFAVHPKRNDVQTLIDVQKLMVWADIIDIHYWKSGEVLRTSFPKEFNAKKKILFHFNPYDIHTEANQYYDLLVVGNKDMHIQLPAAHLIPYCIDLSFFTYNTDYTQDTQVMMSVNRIEGKKGVLEVAQACKELGYSFRLVGRVSKPDYAREVMKAGDTAITFVENATDDILRQAYYESAIHVCNSVDGFESGTLPILESMACGTPVLTRMIGHVPDLYNGKNMVVRKGQPEDVEELKKCLREMMENREWRETLRRNAWDTARTRDDRRMALDVNKLYYRLYQPDVPFVSIIIPTKDNPASFTETLVSAVQQDHTKFEVIVSDSGDESVKRIVDAVRKQVEVPIKYIHFKHKDNYTLAEARNRAVMEADGDILVFCDDRLKMAKNAVTVFATYYRPKAWLWGVKDKMTKGFVENFSCVGRRDLIDYGMFNERIQWYGGLTQETRERFELRNGFDFICMPEAEAESVKRATSKNRRRNDIIEAKFTVYKLHGK